MGRPRKIGLDYFPKDVDFWDDYKIMDLLNEYGPFGICIYDIILCQVYKNGYYLEVPIDKLVSQIIRIIGNRWIKDKSLVLQVIQYCADIGLIDHALLQQSVITSVGIQRRYSEVTVRNKVDKSKYWLLEEEESQAALKSAHSESVSAAETGVFVTETKVNAEVIPQSKVKESKVKKSKVKCVLRLPCRNGEFVVDEELFTELIHTYPNMDVKKSLEKLSVYLKAKPFKQGLVSSAEGYIRMRLSDDDAQGKYRLNKKSGYDEYDDCEFYEKYSRLYMLEQFKDLEDPAEDNDDEDAAGGYDSYK